MWFVWPIWIANWNKIKRSIIMKNQNVMEILTISVVLWVVNVDCRYNQQQKILSWWFMVSLWLVVSVHMVVFGVQRTFRWFVVYIASFHCYQVFLCCLILRLAPFFICMYLNKCLCSVYLSIKHLLNLFFILLVLQAFIVSMYQLIQELSANIIGNLFAISFWPNNWFPILCVNGTWSSWIPWYSSSPDKHLNIFINISKSIVFICTYWCVLCANLLVLCIYFLLPAANIGYQKIFFLLSEGNWLNWPID